MHPHGTWDANLTQPEPDVATLRCDSRGLDASRSHAFAEVESPSPQKALRDSVLPSPACGNRLSPELLERRFLEWCGNAS